MTQATTGSEPLLLFEALKTHCSPSLMADLRREELQLTRYQHQQRGQPLLSDVSELRQPNDGDWMDGQRDFSDFYNAWDRVLENFQGIIEQGAVELDGVQILPVATTDRVDLPGAWAAMMRFDLRANTIGTHHAKYASIRVHRPRPAKADVPPGVCSARMSTDASGKVWLKPTDVGSLSDDTILSLLEEHARRVVGTPDAKLISPGKVSFLPIILRKMTHRAELGELLPRLVDEGEYLAQWIASKIDHHHLPSAGTITKTLGKNYAVLKARSTAATQ